MRVEGAHRPFERKIVSSFSTSSAVNSKADLFSRNGKYLEVVPNRNKTELPSLSGYNLTKGMVVYRGDVKDVEAPLGGTYYIDGNVEQLEGASYGGIVYINGDLAKLKDTDSTILIVTGEVAEYEQNSVSAGGSRLPITHSPFLFSPHPIKGHLLNEYGNRQGEIEPGMVVDSQRLSNWLPKDTVAKALELCRERIALENERRMKEAQEITNPDEMIVFYEKAYQGYTLGYSRGYYDAPDTIDMD